MLGNLGWFHFHVLKTRLAHCPPVVVVFRSPYVTTWA
ncbi:unnamed protein product [Schistosoma curassoni]|uniref:Usp domain-containing protein n=1 Tax=Schistosoma curassoni TaxID=6186 RepID=A0A183KIG2_9TREM|nr:unnamed protein product [Schistosoma curassoni]